VVERTREIGRCAPSAERGGVVRLFATESMLLTLIGCVAGWRSRCCGWGSIMQIFYIRQ